MFSNDFRFHPHCLSFKLDNKILSLYLNERVNTTYDIDGIVVQSNKYYPRNESGNPKHIFAFKENNKDK